MRLGKSCDFDQCIRTEFRIVSRVMRGHDLYEGIRAVIVDKDQAPRWQPATLEAVDPREVEQHFEPVENELAAAMREIDDRVRTLEPVQAGEREAQGPRWAHWLLVFLRVMAGLSLLKGLYHWASGLRHRRAAAWRASTSYPAPYQVATAFFGVIDLVAAVGLWLAAPWGAVIWLTSVISMVAVELLFPQVFGGNMVVVGVEVVLLATYIVLAILAAREQPN